MKFIIFGGKGWIGNKIVQLLKNDNHEVILPDIRVDNTPELKIFLSNILRSSSPEDIRIISTIGRTHGENFNTIDYLEQPGKLKENLRDNLYGPVSLAILCSQLNIHYTYLGTGCIFNYDEENNRTIFSEEDYPNFFGSSYSTAKGYTDSLMKLLNVLNLRIRMPISSEVNKREFITKIMGYPNICSIPNSMTVLDDFLPILCDMSLKKETGTYNFTNPGVIEHKEILEMVDPDHKYNLIDYKTQMTFIKSDRSNNHLNTHKIKKKYPEIKNIKKSISDIIKKRK